MAEEREGDPVGGDGRSLAAVRRTGEFGREDAAVEVAESVDELDSPRACVQLPAGVSTEEVESRFMLPG